MGLRTSNAKRPAAIASSRESPNHTPKNRHNRCLQQKGTGLPQIDESTEISVRARHLCCDPRSPITTGGVVGLAQASELPSEDDRGPRRTNEATSRSQVEDLGTMTTSSPSSRAPLVRYRPSAAALAFWPFDPTRSRGSGALQSQTKRAPACANLQRVEKILVVPWWSHLPEMSPVGQGPRAACSAVFRRARRGN
jgi:hypothetical protein